MAWRRLMIRGLVAIAVAGYVLIAYEVAIFILASFSTTVARLGVAFGLMFIAISLGLYLQQKLNSVLNWLLLPVSRQNYPALNRLKTTLLKSLPLVDLLKAISTTFQHDVGYAKVAILLPDHEGQEFSTVTQNSVISSKQRLPFDHPLVRMIGSQSGSILSNDQKQFVHNTLAWLGVDVIEPLFAGQKLTGLIFLSGKSGRALSGADQKAHHVFLTHLADLVAPVLEHARVYRDERMANMQLRRRIKQITHELTQASEYLRKIDQAKSEFLSIASHQLYTPLTAIRGYLAMLADGDFGAVSDEQQPVVAILNKSANRLISLIKNLLDISRIESGRLELNLKALDLSLLAKELVQDLMPNAMKKSLDLQFMPAEENVSAVVGDDQRLRQIMLNFIDNAIKYTDRGRIEVSVKQIGEEVVFAVTDTGKGISRDEIARLFTKFTRVGGADRFHTEGTGLGLYVARQIINEHHGEVAVHSPGAGKGTTFSMRLPMEGAPRSLNVNDTASVVIKAAEAGSEVQSARH